MSGIVCAVRGGPRSRATIQRAIDLAKEKELLLAFLYVVNLDFLSRTTSSRTQAINEEMHQMGEFILLSAQAKANAQGVDAQSIIRHGNVVAEIIELSHEIDADYIVLGRPGDSGAESLFAHQELIEFARQIEEDTGAQVIFAGEEGS